MLHLKNISYFAVFLYYMINITSIFLIDAIYWYLLMPLTYIFTIFVALKKKIIIFAYGK